MTADQIDATGASRQQRMHVTVGGAAEHNTVNARALAVAWREIVLQLDDLFADGGTR